ncbi:hypothetical protein AAC387_Pa04g2689 [Persea americana]
MKNSPARDRSAALRSVRSNYLGLEIGTGMRERRERNETLGNLEREGGTLQLRCGEISLREMALCTWGGISSIEQQLRCMWRNLNKRRLCVLGTCGAFHRAVVSGPHLLGDPDW